MNNKATVYFTRDLSEKGLLKIYKRICENNGKNIKDFSLGFTDVLINSSLYSNSSVGSIILGMEDYCLIKTNPNSSLAPEKTSKERIEESIQRTFQNFERNEVAIPTFNEIISLDNDKDIRVIVGNFTNPSNLTHGERTASCMRIGGVGESLYEFCLDSPFGFHIRFEDNETGEYVSRVSGFRNGNTVYLNELRYSCNTNLYSNNDVVDACRKAAEMIIEKSKGSSSPIDNVVISKEYAMEETNYQKQNIGVSNIKEGLSNFYSDVNAYCIILATNAKKGSFTPVNFDNSRIKMYLPAREIVKETTDVKIACDIINRIHLVKEQLEKNSYEYSKIVLTEELIYCISNQDWYIWVDSNLEIHEELITVDKRAVIEYNEAKSKVAEFVTNVTNERVGAIKHGI